jgi:hypothetical protein
MAFTPNRLIYYGFAAIGAGYVWKLARGDDAEPATMVPPDRQLGYAAGGERNAEGIRSLVQHPVANIDQRVGYIVQQIRKDSEDKDVISEARSIVSGKCESERGHLDWCLPVGTLILRKPYDLVPIEAIQRGDIIMGDGGWTTVLNTFDMGVKPLLAFTLNNGSVLRCTAEHKLFVVPRRDRKGRPIPHGKRPKESFPGRREDAIEVRAGDVCLDDELLQPESLPFGDESLPADMALILGAYIAEGWLEPSRASIAGIPDSKGVREKVIAAADRLGIEHSEDEFKVRLKGREVVAALSVCGKLAANKQIPSLNFDGATVEALLVGINADASFVDARQTPMPRFQTTSPLLAQQYRLLYRMLGHSASVKVTKKDGCAPLHHIDVRTKEAKRGSKAWAKVLSISEEAPVQTFDLETESRRIYLPECDVVVHNCVAPKDWKGEIAMLFHAVTDPNSKMAMRYTRDHATIDLFGSSSLLRRLPSGDCDDMAIRLGALLRSIGYAVRCRIVAPAGQPRQWAHIYLMVGNEPGTPSPSRWYALDPTEPQHGPFWEVPDRLISTKKDYEV